MSFNMQADVLFYQRFLKCNGFYQGKLDGDWGPKTDAADAAFQEQTARIKAQEGSFDARSESNIQTLAPLAQVTARRFLAFCLNAGQDVRLLSGTRTYEHQDSLYAQGRTRPGVIVTKARGGQSNHNFGIAWDIGLFEQKQYITHDKPYIALAATVLPHLPQLEWGGNWKSFKDVPHYQLKATCGTLAAVRKNFESGKAFV